VRPSGTLGTPGAPADPGHHRADEDAADLAAEIGIEADQVADLMGQAQNPLPHRCVGQDVVDEMGGEVGHALRTAARTEPATFAGERHQGVTLARRAVHADEPSTELATVQEGPELTLDESRQLAAALPRSVEKRLEVRGDQTVQTAPLRPPPAIPPGRSTAVAHTDRWRGAVVRLRIGPTDSA
jgi:hypothetical protein